MRKSGIEFIQIPLEFDMNIRENVFGGKNNKTLARTIQDKRYMKFSTVVNAQYQSKLSMPLGEFLLNLKMVGDQYYTTFLNCSGDKRYRNFAISLAKHHEKKGVYTYLLNGEVVYIGRCRDSMKKRINSGYGKITPKNCYIDGQSTNCHLNSLIAEQYNNITLWLHEMDNIDEICALEKELLSEHRPKWNKTYS